jgi:hypothetical protein
MQTSVSSGNPTLDADVERLRKVGYEVELLDAPPEVGVLIHNVSLPEGWNRHEVDVLLRTTTVYPASEMDMFWVSPDLRLSSGAVPQAASDEGHFGGPWLRFSWHRNAPWSPGRDDLVSHFEFCLARLSRIE